MNRLWSYGKCDLVEGKILVPLCSDSPLGTRHSHSNGLRSTGAPDRSHREFGSYRASNTVVLFFFIGILCLGTYLIYDLLWVLFLRSNKVKRVKSFFQSMLLYVLVCLGGWLVLVLLEMAVDSL